MKLVILVNSSFAGDNNQSFGIAKGFSLPDETVVIEEKEFDLSCLHSTDHVLVAGEHGLKMAVQIKSEGLATKITWSGHLFFDEFFKISKEHWPDLIALPKSVVTPEIISLVPTHCELIKTDGVAHQVDGESIDGSVKTFSEKLPTDTVSTCVGIIIAGDAPDADKSIKCFDQLDARLQAKKIAAYINASDIDAKNLALMVTNGPRTGKYDPEKKTPLTPEPHRNGLLDKVSSAFVEELESSFPGKIFFYDFQFGQTSAYQPMMFRVCQAERAFWFVSVDSSSMVTESTYLRTKNVQVIAYTPASANDAHIKLVKDAEINGLVSMIDQPLLPLGKELPVVKLASRQIAEALKAMVLKDQKSNEIANPEKITPYLPLTLHGKSTPATSKVPEIIQTSSYTK